MPDPHVDLANIVEPAPPLAAAQPDFVAPITAALAGIMLIAGGYAYWRRGRRLRRLRRLAHSTDVAAAATELAHMQFVSPPSAWREALDHLRFARPHPESATSDADTLKRLCREAESFPN